MSDPSPINALNITGYIVLGNKKLNIRVTLDDIEPNVIDGESHRESGRTDTTSEEDRQEAGSDNDAVEPELVARTEDDREQPPDRGQHVSQRPMSRVLHRHVPHCPLDGS